MKTMNLDRLQDESPTALKRRARKMAKILMEEYAHADCALHHKNALELLVATILSAQCTDERVNQTTPTLFTEFKSATDYANADLEKIERIIHSLGFFRNKAKSLKKLGIALIEKHDGEVPDTLEALVKLPGVGRKTANVILGTWFGKPGITVDTHVQRLTRKRFEWTEETDPVKIEFDLQALFPEEWWTPLSHAIIWHGRELCPARSPQCEACPLTGDCPWPARQLAE